MENPFIYGEAVYGKNFCNRSREIEKLKKDLLSSQKIFLISTRKIGKTSLIKVVLEKLKKKHLLNIFIELGGFSSYKDFLDTYLMKLLSLLGSIQKITAFVHRVLIGIKVELKIDEQGKPLISLGYQRQAPELERIATKIYGLPKIISNSQKKKLVIVFDEFQEIFKLNGSHIEASLRNNIQHQREVGYIFSGSKRHMLLDMISSPHRPFYKIGPTMHLDKIPKEEFREFIKEKFQNSRIKISNSVIEQIIERADNIPYYIQMLCHELWDYAIMKKKIISEDIDRIINQLISQNQPTFQLEWSHLILKKRQVLKAIATKGGKNVLSKDYLLENQLGYPSPVQRTLISLAEEGYLDKYQEEYFFTDLLLKEWIKLYIK